MKVDVDIPDEILKQVDTLAKELNQGRDQIFVQALKIFVDQHHEDRAWERETLRSMRQVSW